MGKILYSGIAPEDVSRIQPADYALEPGVDALMDSPDQRRRRFLLMGLGAFGATATLGFFGGVWATASDTSQHPDPNRPRPNEPIPTRRRQLTAEEKLRVEGARALARGSIIELSKYHVGFLAVFEEYGADDPVLWSGVEKLLKVSLIETGSNGELMRDLLTRALHVRGCPERLRYLHRKLSELKANDRRRNR